MLTNKKFLIVSFSLIFLASCGGGSDTSIASPGELSQVEAPTATATTVAEVDRFLQVVVLLEQMYLQTLQ